MLKKFLLGITMLALMACHDQQLLQESELNEVELRRYAKADLAALKRFLAVKLGHSVENEPRIYVNSFRVPLDYHNQANPIEVELNYLIHYAKDNPQTKPTLFLHYGGPGVSPLKRYAKDSLNSIFGTAATKGRFYDHFRDFNVVLLEARMTGYSGFSGLFDQDSKLTAAAAITQIQRFGKV